MHPLLKRQLKRLGATDPTMPLSSEHWGQLLERVSNAYTEADQGREILERSLALSSKEMQQLYDNLRLTSETRLKTEQERTKMIVDSALDAIISVNEAGIIIDWNPQAEHLFGWTKKEIVGQPVVDTIIPPTFREALNLGLARYLETRQSTILNQRIEVSALNRQGETFPAEISVSPFMVDGGIIFSTFIRDITERKNAEHTLRQAKDTAEQAAKAKSEFLATMSHEIRTPMNGIIGMTGLLLDTSLSSQQHQFAETVRSSGEALLTIINDILDFSKIEAGKLDFETIDFDLRVAMEDTLDLFAEKAESANLELVGIVDSAIPTALRGDPGRFRQVLLNLIGNAIKFTKEGTVSVRITLDAEAPDEVTIRVAVTDTGMGIDPIIQQQLFQPFQQADSSTTRQFGGTGLGLAICKKLVERMSGTIGIESTVGQGSTFWFTAQYIKQSKSPVDPQTKDLDNVRLCYIDDHPINRKLVEEYAKAWGMQMTAVSTPAEGLEELHLAMNKGEPFHVAIVDMLMPGMDGLALARSIKANPQLSATRLILLSSIGRRGDAKDAKAAGFSGYLTKPIRQNVLKRTLETVMGLERENMDHRDTPVITRFTSLESAESVGHRILVVDDHQVNQQLAVMMIERLGHRVNVAANGQEAIDALKTIPYDLIFMDCHMPVMDGYEATKKIREAESGKLKGVGVRSKEEEIALSDSADSLLLAPHGPRVPIVAMTANVMPQDREKCLQAGMDDYLSKPIRPEGLVRIFAKWLAASTPK